MLVSDELNKRGRGRNPKYTTRAQPVRRPRRGWHGLGPDITPRRSPQVMSLTKAVDKVRALPELRLCVCRPSLLCGADDRREADVGALRRAGVGRVAVLVRQGDARRDDAPERQVPPGAREGVGAAAAAGALRSTPVAPEESQAAG